jgi:hypothetical protein
MSKLYVLLLSCCVACVIIFGSCAGLARMYAPPARVFHVKVVADISFADNIMWKKNAASLIENASSFFTSWFGAAFIVDTMIVWGHEQSPCFSTMFEMDCLVKSIPKGNSDIVVYFNKERDPRDYWLIGLAQLEFSYVRVTQADWIQYKGGYEEALLILIHELCHLFGAMHVDPGNKSNQNDLMLPWMSNTLIDTKGKGVNITIPDFHPANAAIVNTCIGRSFDIHPRDTSFWSKIHSAYRSLRNVYCTVNIEKGKLRALKTVDFLPHDYYRFCAEWASLCGHDSTAFVYADSIRIAADAWKAMCEEGGANCQSSFCRRTGCSKAAISLVYQSRIAGYHYVLAGLHLRNGSVATAMRGLDEFLELYPEMKVDVKNKFRNGFALRGELYETYASSVER